MNTQHTKPKLTNTQACTHFKKSALAVLCCTLMLSACGGSENQSGFNPEQPSNSQTSPDAPSAENPAAPPASEQPANQTPPETQPNNPPKSPTSEAADGPAAPANPAVTPTPNNPPSAKPDTDRDGVANDSDNCPNTVNAGQKDLDNDGKGDVCDSDKDGDGVDNAADAFPDDKNESLDTDSDGTGNNADTDDDGDGYSDAAEQAAGTDPLDATDKPAPTVADTDNDGVEDAKDARPNDPNVAGEVIKTHFKADGSVHSTETYLFNAKKQPVKSTTQLSASTTEKAWVYDAQGRIKQITTTENGKVEDILNATYSNNSATSYIRMDEIDNGNDGSADVYMRYKVRNNRLVERAQLPDKNDNSSFLVTIYEYLSGKVSSVSNREAKRSGDSINFIAPAKSFYRYNYTGNKLTSKVSSFFEYFYEYNSLDQLVGIESQSLSAQPTDEIGRGFELFRYNGGKLSHVGSVDATTTLPAGQPFCCRGISKLDKADPYAGWEIKYSYNNGRMIRKVMPQGTPSEYSLTYSQDGKSASVDYFFNGLSSTSYQVTFDNEQRPKSATKYDQGTQTAKTTVSYKGVFDDKVTYFYPYHHITASGSLSDVFEFSEENILPDRKMRAKLKQNVLTQFNID